MFATGIFTLGLRAAVGIAAVPLAIAVFVILGNPSAGGAFGPNVIPTLYRAIGRWITPGAGTEAFAASSTSAAPGWDSRPPHWPSTRRSASRSSSDAPRRTDRGPGARET